MNRKIQIFIVLLILIVSTGFSQMGNSRYKAEIKRDTIIIGDTLSLVLQLNYRQNQMFVFPEFKDTLTKGLDIFQIPKTDTFTNSNGLKFARKTINLISFEPGKYIIQGFPALLVNANGVTDTIFSNPVNITVLPMPIDTNAIDTVFAGIDGKIILGLDFAASVKENLISDSLQQSMTQQEIDQMINQIYQSKRSEILVELAKQLGISDTTGYVILLEEIVMAPRNQLFIIKNSQIVERHVLPMLIKENFIQQKKEVKKGDPLFSYFLINDIKPPYNEEWSVWDNIKLFFQDYGLYIVIIILLIAIVILYFLYFRKKKLPESDIPKIPLEPAHIIALRDLNDLKAKKLWQAGKIKEFHSKLTEILRRYLEHRYKVNALEQTTFEILQAFSKTKILSKKDINILKEILELADLVKFAKFTPIPDENDRCLSNSYQFVEKTKFIEKEIVASENEIENIEEVEQIITDKKIENGNVKQLNQGEDN